MKLFEYQAKEAFRQKGLPTPEGVLIHGMGELDDALARTGFPCVLKAQVLRGGRGKAGLIKVARDAASARSAAAGLFASEHQVRMLLVEEAVDIAREIYLQYRKAMQAKQTRMRLITSAGVMRMGWATSEAMMK